MMHFEGRDRVGPTLQDAETLVRSLVGVAAVRIITNPDGSLREIVVVPESDASVRQVSRNVTSALMAGFGLDLDPDSISIAGPPADNSEGTQGSGTRPAVAGRVGNGTHPTHAGTAGEPDASSARSAPDGANGAHGANGAARQLNGAVDANTARPDVANGHSAEPPAPVWNSVRVHAPVRPRLELVDIARANGSVRCRVVVATGSERFVGVGNGDDAGTSDHELAGRVAVDALRVARAPRDPIQFDGASRVEIAGRSHVAVSLSIWTGYDFEPIAGAAPILGSPAEAAAQAVIDSIVAHLIT